MSGGVERTRAASGGGDRVQWRQGWRRFGFGTAATELGKWRRGRDRKEERKKTSRTKLVTIWRDFGWIRPVGFDVRVRVYLYIRHIYEAEFEKCRTVWMFELALKGPIGPGCPPKHLERV